MRVNNIFNYPLKKKHMIEKGNNITFVTYNVVLSELVHNYLQVASLMCLTFKYTI